MVWSDLGRGSHGVSDQLTTNYSWIKPEDQASFGSGGQKFNDDLDSIDTTVKAVSDVASGAVALAGSTGGVMTGEVSLVEVSYRVLSLTNQSGTVSLNLFGAVGFTVAFNGDPTFSFDTPPTIRGFMKFWIKVTNLGGYTSHWPSNVYGDFQGSGVQGSATTSDIIEVVTFNAGVTWYTYWFARNLS